MKYLINSVGENLESNEHKISFMRHTRKAKCFRFFWKNIPLKKNLTYTHYLYNEIPTLALVVFLFLAAKV